CTSQKNEFLITSAIGINHIQFKYSLSILPINRKRDHSITNPCGIDLALTY
ncbi:unnamed protein product, partial [Prunus brigantina]